MLYSSPLSSNVLLYLLLACLVWVAGITLGLVHLLGAPTFAAWLIAGAIGGGSAMCLLLINRAIHAAPLDPAEQHDSLLRPRPVPNALLRDSRSRLPRASAPTLQTGQFDRGIPGLSGATTSRTSPTRLGDSARTGGTGARLPAHAPILTSSASSETGYGTDEAS